MTFVNTLIGNQSYYSVTRNTMTRPRGRTARTVALVSLCLGEVEDGPVTTGTGRAHHR
jgi:hypothetical protein